MALSCPEDSILVQADLELVLPLQHILPACSTTTGFIGVKLSTLSLAWFCVTVTKYWRQLTLERDKVYLQSVGRFKVQDWVGGKCCVDLVYWGR